MTDWILEDENTGPKYGIRRLEDKYAMSQLRIIAWSDKIDVMAVSNPQGDLMLYRLNWTKVWVRKPPMENLSIVGIAWRPDSRVLAVAYDNWEVHLINVEKQIFIDKLVQGDEIYMLKWLQENDSVDRLTEYLDLMDGLDVKQKGSAFPMKSEEEVVHDVKIGSNQRNNSFLAIGYKNSIYFYTFGFLNAGKIELSKCAGHRDVFPIDAYITKRMQTMGVVCKVVDTNEAVYLQFNMSRVFGIPQSHYMMAIKRASIFGDMLNVDRCVAGIMETWENIYLNELEIPLRKYAKGKPRGTVGTELLELLLTGRSTQSLHNFLMNDLSERKVKKLGSSIEACYTCIQKFILDHLRPGLEALSYNITTLKGLDRVIKFNDYANRMYINKNILTESLIQCNVAHMKCTEMLSIIEDCAGIRPAFFQWLAYNISKLCDIDTIATKPRLSEDKVQGIAKYIRSLESRDNRTSDPLAQYLTKERLLDAPEWPNEWSEFLKQNPCLNASKLIMSPEYERDNLLSVHERLNSMWKELFTGMDSVMDDVEFRFSHKLGNVVKVSMIECSKTENIIVACLMDGKGSEADIVGGVLYVADFQWMIEQSDKRSKVISGSSEIVLKDVQFYSEKTVCVLVHHEIWDQTYIIQIPIDIALYDDVNYDIGRLILSDFSKQILEMKPTKFFLNCHRKVCIMTAPPGHRLRIYEMEAEEDTFEMEAFEEGDYKGEEMDTTSGKEEMDTISKTGDGGEGEESEGEDSKNEQEQEGDPSSLADPSSSADSFVDDCFENEYLYETFYAVVDGEAGCDTFEHMFKDVKKYRSLKECLQ